MRLARSWWLFAGGAVLVCVIWLRLPPASSQDWDLVTYRATVERMQAGEDYYQAMTEGLIVTDVGPVSYPMNYRLPTVFWLWRWCCFSWPATLALVVLIGALVGLASLPAVGLLTMLWLAALLHPVGAEQWAFVETWAVPFCIGSVLALRRGAWGWAALLALCAALVREQAVLLLLGGLLGAWHYRKMLWPWLAGLIAWASYLMWHIGQARPYLVEQGRQPPILDGHPGAVLEMAGPATFGLGFLLVVAVLWHTRWTPEWWLVAPLLALIPLAGLLTSRFHWGILVLPVALAVQPLAGRRQLGGVHPGVDRARRWRGVAESGLHHGDVARDGE